MEQKIKMTSIITDVRTIGGIFYLPIALMITSVIYILNRYSGYEDPNILQIIRSYFGVFSIPFISVWIFNLYQDILETDGKECLLSLPYKDIQFGLFRVLRITILYIIVFFILFLILILTLLPAEQRILLSDLYLPFISIFYFSSLSFLVIVLVKNTLISYSIIGIYSIFQYTTRGGFSLSVYPFQWPFPHPMYNNYQVGINLFLFSLIFYILAHLIFKKRDYLIK